MHGENAFPRVHALFPSRMRISQAMRRGKISSISRGSEGGGTFEEDASKTDKTILARPHKVRNAGQLALSLVILLAVSCHCCCYIILLFLLIFCVTFAIPRSIETKFLQSKSAYAVCLDFISASKLSAYFISVYI